MHSLFSRYLYKLTLFIFTISACITEGYTQELKVLVTKDSTSFRGLDTWGKNCLWVTGSQGSVGRSTDCGNTWDWVSPAGYEKFDFRDIEAFSDNEAVIISAGSPAVVLRTIDAGKSWHEVYRDERPQIFLDGMDFNGKHGFILGDPIDGNFQLLESKDRGKTWTDVSNFLYLFADDGEAAFAASGTSLKILGSDLYVGTGGAVSNFITRRGKKRAVIKLPVPIIQGTASTGIFSIDCWNKENIIVVGGDYQNDTYNNDVALSSHDGGLNWTAPETPLSGYKSCVKYLTKDVLIATGTSGTDISTDGGKNWSLLSNEGYHSLKQDKTGKNVYLAGHERIGVIIM